MNKKIIFARSTIKFSYILYVLIESHVGPPESDHLRTITEGRVSLAKIARELATDKEMLQASYTKK
jgi:hypothetical protein